MRLTAGEGCAEVAPLHADFASPDDFDFERRHAVKGWPGPVCGVCWAAGCCECGYVFADSDEAFGHDLKTGRLVCIGCGRR